MPLILRKPARDMRKQTFLIFVSVWIGMIGPVFAQTAEHAPPDIAHPHPHVLVLYSYGYGGRGVEVFSDGLIAAMTARGVAVNDLFFEYLDLERHKDPEYRVRLVQSLNRKYEKEDIGIVVTVQQPALDFLLQDGIGIAPGKPVVSVQAQVPSDASARERQIVSRLAHFDISGTLKQAVQIFPQTQNVLFVSGSSPADRRMAEEASKVAANWDNKLNFEYTTGLSFEQIIQKSQNLPAHSLIVFTQYNDDMKGHVALAYEVEGAIVKVANAPVFGLYDFNLANGGVGGSVISVRSLGIETADLALNILEGKYAPDKAVTVLDMNAIPIFDWQKVKRWGGNPENVGPETVFVNRIPNIWEQYASYIVLVLLFILIETLLIAGLLISRRQRTHAEEKLRVSEERMRLFFERQSVGMAITSPKKGWLQVNDRLCEMLGYSRDELSGRTWAEMTHPEDLPGDQIQFNQLLAGDVDGYTREKRYICKNGSVVFTELSVVCVRHPDGSINYVLALLNDITERKQLEFSLRKTNAELEQFAYIASHDLREPLRMVSSYLTLIEKNLGANLSQEVKKYFGFAVGGAKRMDQMIRDLLEYSRIGRAAVGSELVALSDVVAQSLIELSVAIADAGAKVTVADALPEIVGAPSALTRLFVNLVGNAIKYRHAERNPETEIGHRDAGAEYVVWVKDNGMGIAPEQQDRAFVIFQRLVLRSDYEGTGIGLAVCRKIVEQHGGRIWVESEVGKGSTFFMTFPKQVKCGERTMVSDLVVG